MLIGVCSTLDRLHSTEANRLPLFPLVIRQGWFSWLTILRSDDQPTHSPCSRQTLFSMKNHNIEFKSATSHSPYPPNYLNITHKEQSSKLAGTICCRFCAIVGELVTVGVFPANPDGRCPMEWTSVTWVMESCMWRRKKKNDHFSTHELLFGDKLKWQLWDNPMSRTHDRLLLLWHPLDYHSNLITSMEFHYLSLSPLCNKWYLYTS